MAKGKINGNSLDVKSEKIEVLKKEFPEIFTEGKIDLDKLKKSIGEFVNSDRERYGVSWAGKSDCFRHIQEPTTATLEPIRDESVDFDTTQNIFIEGDNLSALKVLQKSYYGKVKMIYIDPPYNTGSDSFIYPDRFQETQEEYLKRIGDKDAEGNLMRDGLFRINSKENGHYHSNWMSMMYPRLFLARNLMRDDGVIFVSIDDNEVHNLRIIMNEVFGEDNFVEMFSWQKTETPPNLSKLTKKSLEYVLCYRKSDSRKSFLGLAKSSESSNGLMNRTNAVKTLIFPANKIDTGIEDGVIVKGEYGTSKYKIALLEDTEVQGGYFIKPIVLEGKFKWKQENLDREISEGTVLSIRTKSLSPSYERANYAPEVPWNLIDRDFGVGTNENASEELDDLFGVKEIFDHPKPPSLIKYLLGFLRDSNNEGDIILDFFAGSGSMAHAVMQLNAEDNGSRKYILVQLPEKTGEDSEAFKAEYKTISDISKERIRRAGKKIKEDNKGKGGIERLDIGFKVFKLQDSNFKIWDQNKIKTVEDLKQNMLAFVSNTKEQATHEGLVYEILLKIGMDLNTSITRNTLSGKECFAVGDQDVIITLAPEVDPMLIDEIVHIKPRVFICMDDAFKNNDQLKTNVSLELKNSGIDLRCI